MRNYRIHSVESGTEPTGSKKWSSIRAVLVCVGVVHARLSPVLGEQGKSPRRDSAMNDRPTELERAFQLARSGRCSCVEDVRHRLKSEGYSTLQITGKSLARQLLTLIQAARESRLAREDDRRA
jgi:hypothetical protein